MSRLGVLADASCNAFVSLTVGGRIRSVERVVNEAARAGVPARVIGRTGGAEIRIDVAGVPAIRMATAAAERVWATAIGRHFKTTAGAA